MNYIDQNLIFEDDKIYFINSRGEERQVMMSWENNLMKKHADYICQNGGDILEVGFGMGIAADYIQANNPTSHTIVENHPQIIEKAKAWAEGKSNVIIVEGDWLEKLSELSVYDGIFADTYGDENFANFAETFPIIIKENGFARLNVGCKDTRAPHKKGNFPTASGTVSNTHLTLATKA